MPDSSLTAGSRAEQAKAVLASVDPRPGVPKPDPILVADHVRRAFGGLTAVDVEHVEIQRGAITALIGPNGAGKTTFFNLITGFDAANEGSWTFNGRQVAGTAPYRLARIGMVRTFQLTKALSRMTVMDNMQLGAKHQTGEHFFAAIFPMEGYRSCTVLISTRDHRRSGIVMTRNPVLAAGASARFGMFCVKATTVPGRSAAGNRKLRSPGFPRVTCR